MTSIVAIKDADGVVFGSDTEVGPTRLPPELGKHGVYRFSNTKAVIGFSGMGRPIQLIMTLDFSKIVIDVDDPWTSIVTKYVPLVRQHLEINGCVRRNDNGSEESRVIPSTTNP